MGGGSRLLTQKIRSRGTMLGKVVVAPLGGAGDGGPEAVEAALEAEAEAVGWVDPAKANLVKEVSVKVYVSNKCGKCHVFF